ncbi:hypothetical protein ABZT03_03485 [Streptomyces sp. NPDC005574]|uniref:hypothetical protein n=1 Tax=Streptomyces sp. NPDC005574 TaxID=3156891 RepID=UPI0033ABFF67
MTRAGGERRRRAWRWALVVWAVTVAVGGGLTLWLQDSAEPRPGWYSGPETPDPAASLLRREMDAGDCPRLGASPRSVEESGAVGCAYMLGTRGP